MTNYVFIDYFVRYLRRLSQGMYKKVSYTRMRKFMIQKRKKNLLYYNKGTIDYNQQCHSLHLGDKQYKQFPQKKISRERKRKEKRKRESAKGKEKEMENRRKR